MSQFGEWYFDEDEGTVWLIDDDGGHSTEICEVSADNVGPLIAAAPALLAACQKIVRNCCPYVSVWQFDETIDGNKLFVELEAAIAAALPPKPEAT